MCYDIYMSKSKLNKEAITELRKLGFTYQAIAGIFNVTTSAIHKAINLDKEKRNTYARERSRRSYLIVNGKNTKVDKRPRPDNICEVCGIVVSRLDYHHWDDTKPKHGIWLCKWCHHMAEGVDTNLHIKYLKLKDEISNI